ncbi:MAG: serine hydrolase [Pyrinomonadaceae bacterium]
MTKTLVALVRAIEGAEAAVAFHDLETGVELLIKPDLDFHAASTMKVPVMMEVFPWRGDARLSLDEKVEVRNKFKSIVDQSVYTLSAESDSEQTLYGKIGQTVPLRGLIRLMITESATWRPTY